MEAPEEKDIEKKNDAAGKDYDWWTGADYKGRNYTIPKAADEVKKTQGREGHLSLYFFEWRNRSRMSSARYVASLSSSPALRNLWYKNEGDALYRTTVTSVSEDGDWTRHAEARWIFACLD